MLSKLPLPPFPPVERYLYISGCRDRVIGIHISFLCTVSRSLPYRLPERGQVDVRTFGQRQRWQTLSFRVVRAGTRSKRAVSETVPRRLRHGQVRWLPATMLFHSRTSLPSCLTRLLHFAANFSSFYIYIYIISSVACKSLKSADTWPEKRTKREWKRGRETLSVFNTFERLDARA